MQVLEQSCCHTTTVLEPREGVIRHGNVIEDLPQVEVVRRFVVRDQDVAEWCVRAFESRRALRLPSECRATQEGRIRKLSSRAVECRERCACVGDFEVRLGTQSRGLLGQRVGDEGEMAPRAVAGVCPCDGHQVAG